MINQAPDLQDAKDLTTRFVADDVQLPQLHRRGRRPAARRGASPPHARR